eukprot:TRINITY_DN813_c0_g2_i1.p1 TRINITY_DN813_c0_g2~~TRINITY_DN813_c0_g2_i1.p1  ORF type:complete len:184 (-),score=22.69 TRINITY_DN813_c0_g2_i1:306-836(-)
MLLGPLRIPFRVLVLTHIVLFCWSQWYVIGLGNMAFAANLIAIAAGMWSLGQKSQREPVLMYLALVCFSMLCDIIQISVYTKEKYTSRETKKDDNFRFALASYIIMIIMKPLIAFGSFQESMDQERDSLTTPSQHTHSNNVTNSVPSTFSGESYQSVEPAQTSSSSPTTASTTSPA